jgi:hypothetical protein
MVDDMAEVQRMSLDALIADVKNRHPDGDVLAHLSDAVLEAEHLGELADHLVGHFVDQARRAGASWTEIGASMGVTKQAVQKRFVPRASAEPASGGVYSRFTLRAKQVVEAAQLGAREAGQDHVGTEHLVLGLLSEPNGLAMQAIEKGAGVTADTVRDAVRERLGPPAESVPEHVPFTPEVKKVLDLTAREALRLGNNYVGTEHILLGLLKEEGSVGASLLTELGVDHAEMEKWIRAALAGFAAGRDVSR